MSPDIVYNSFVDWCQDRGYNISYEFGYWDAKLPEKELNLAKSYLIHKYPNVDIEIINNIINKYS